jgi:ABC-2 type transport system ATP-binding protein
MSEMALTADHLIVIGRGRLIADVAVDEFTRQAQSDLVQVRSPDADRLRHLLVGPGVDVIATSPGRLEITGLSSDQIGDVAAKNAVRVHELVPRQASLEEAFMKLTRDSVEYETPEMVAS